MTSSSNAISNDLIRRARDGDPLARERLFAECRTYVEAMARLHVEPWLRAKADASDIVQQTMLEAHQGFEGFQGETSMEWLAWLRRIVTHNMTDLARQYKNEKRDAFREVRLANPADSAAGVGAAEPSAHIDTPSQVAMRHEDESLLAEAILKLEPDYQRVISLRNLQHLPFDEVAGHMGRSRPAVQMLWARALHRLRETLELMRAPGDEAAAAREQSDG